jgi:2-amino-4-hydroxy-6-hydroxymethyldihydropteridine diphosphokinase
VDERARLLKHLYAIGLGSNQRHHRYGCPRAVLGAAVRQLPGTLVAQSRIIQSRPLGPSQRTYANAAVLLRSKLAPPELLGRLKSIEHDFGRRPHGQRWRARVLDLDILLLGGGIWASPGVIVPHPRMRERAFVLGPLAQIVPGWRDPLTHLTMRQLRVRLDRPRPRD